MICYSYPDDEPEIINLYDVTKRWLPPSVVVHSAFSIRYATIGASSLSLRRHGLVFTFLVGFVLDHAALGYMFLLVLRFLPASIILLMLNTFTS